jgi:hypothetical protein
MIGIVNDAGEIVHAVGATGSLESVKVEYPRLIAKLRGKSDAEALQILREHGPFSPLATQSLLEAAGFGEPEELTRRLAKR